MNKSVDLMININMMIIKLIKLFMYIVALFGFCISAFADEAMDFKIVKIDSRGHIAIIKLPGDKQNIIRVGDSIGDKGKVIEISSGRIVIEEEVESGVDKVIIRFDGKQQTIERISRSAGKTPLLYGPR